MTDDYLKQMNFFEEQLQWIKERDEILEKIEEKLYKMRSIAEYAREYKLSPGEVLRLNSKIRELQAEVVALEKQLDANVH